jgi:zinc protease
MKTILAGVLVATCFLGACSSGPKELGDVKSAEAAARSKPAIDIDYSEEAYRVVADKDMVCTVLKNGLTIIAKRIPSPVISVQGLCHTGSVFEGKWLGGGLSHLLEHLLAGGGNERRTEQQNRDLLQNIGDNSNAYTSYDTTVFFVNTTPSHMAEAVDLVTGWMFTSKIPEAEYKREYEVVQRELEKDLGESDWAFYQLAVGNRYIQNPIRMPVVGYQEVIRGLSRDDVYAYYKTAYIPQNIIIGVAGNAEPEEMVKAVRKYAGNVPPGRVPQKAIAEEPPVSAPRASVGTFPKLGQAKLELAFPSVRQYTPDMYALDVLAAVLGNGESSILVEQIRDQKRLVSAISAGDNTPAFVDGSFQIDMEVAVDKIKPATEAVLGLLDQVKKEGVSEDRLKRAKTQLRAADAFSRQSAEAVSTTLVFSYLNTGFPEDIALSNYEKVTTEQVKAVANKYLDRGRLLTTALLPAEAVAGKDGKDALAGLPAATDLLRQAVPTTQAAPTTKSSDAVTRLELEDGTIVLLKRVATAPVVSMQMYSLGGVTAEDEKTNGIGNLARQLVPRGTATRSAEDIATFFDSIGGQLQTISGNNSWGWEVQFLRGDFARTIDVFADLVKHPSFPESEVKAMQERVAAAIDSQDQTWMGGGNRFFHKVFFGPANSPYQFTALGTKENVGQFSASQLQDWYGNKILKGKRVLAIYGDINLDEATKLVGKHFGVTRPAQGGAMAATNGGGSQQQLVAAPSVTVDNVEVQKWDNPEAAVFIGYKSKSLVKDSGRDALIVADTLTSGFTYPTGYIFETLRGMGLVYDANAQNFWGINDKLTGTFWAYAGCDPKNVDACIDQILLNIARLQGTDKDIDMAWFARAKNLITAVDAMDHETAAAQASEAALDELLGLGHDYHAAFAQRINRVTVDEVRAAARARLRKCVIAVSTSKPELVKAKTGIREYQSFPPVDLTPQGVQHDTGGK